MKFQCAGLTPESIVDGPGIRFTVWTQGCLHHCKECHNPQTWDLNKGYEEDTDEVIKQIIQNPLLDGVTLSGGDPFYQPKPMTELAQKIHSLTKLNIIAYTGFLYEELMTDKERMELLKECDYVVDGPFDINKRSLELKFRGSKNQRFIDVKRSLKENKIIALTDDEITHI